MHKWNTWRQLCRRQVLVGQASHHLDQRRIAFHSRKSSSVILLRIVLLVRVPRSSFRGEENRRKFKLFCRILFCGEFSDGLCDLASLVSDDGFGEPLLFFQTCDGKTKIGDGILQKNLLLKWICIFKGIHPPDIEWPFITQPSRVFLPPEFWQLTTVGIWIANIWIAETSE